MLTSWTDRKSAHKTYIQLIQGKKLEKFVLITWNCPVCIRQRDDVSLATPRRARLVGKAGCLWRLRVPLASLLPSGVPEAAAPHWWMGGELSPLQGWRYSGPWSQSLFYSIFFLPLPSSAASLCFSMFFCKCLSQRTGSLCFPRKACLYFLWDEIQAGKSKNLSSRQWLPLKGACGYDITVFSPGCGMF